MLIRREADLALDFSNRECVRENEFSTVWNEKLDAVFADVAPYYDVASNWASLGLCNRWRRRFVATIDLNPGEKVLDVCAGTNGVGIALLRRLPDISVVAMDRSAAMQEVGRRQAREAGFAIESVIGDVHKLPFRDESFDAVTLQWASRHLKIMDVATEIRRILKPGGRFYHCDMLRPPSKVVEVVYGAYLKACVSMTALAFGSGSEAWSCRDYFVRAVKMFYSAEEFTQMLLRVGFTDVVNHSAGGGVVASHKAVKG
jgi:demethylmenaquinone methyltransferase/2-methoxy-6-polyprenyl-1,4-benzoquinol methylase